MRCVALGFLAGSEVKDTRFMAELRVLRGEMKARFAAFHKSYIGIFKRNEDAWFYQEVAVHSTL